MESIINLLKKLNLTDAEAKVYVALLRFGSSTGYELSKTSSVPRSKIYNVLENLITQGLAVCAKQTTPVLYHAVPAEEMLKNLQREFEQTIAQVKTELSVFDQKLNLGHIWQIREYDNIFNKCKHIIRQTKKELFLQVWKEDFDQIAPELLALEKKKIPTVVIIYSQDRNAVIPIKNYIIHGFAEEKSKEMGGRWITLVSDSKEVIFGQIQNQNTAEVIWTESMPLVFMAKEYVKHDVYFYKALNASRPMMESVFGEDLSKVRDIFGQNPDNQETNKSEKKENKHVTSE